MCSAGLLASAKSQDLEVANVGGTPPCVHLVASMPGLPPVC